MKISKPVALQLFSLRRELQEDFCGTLEKVAEIGYDGVEFAAFYDHPAQEIRDCLDRVGMKAISSHVSLARLEKNFEAEVEFHKILGCKYIAIPYADGDHQSDGPLFEESFKVYSEIGKRLKEHGIELLYHNHEFEFADYKGECGLDYMYRHLPAEYVAPELDVCWTEVAGKSAPEYIRKYNGRLKVVHLKDFIKKDSAKGAAMYQLIDNKGIVKDEEKEAKPIVFRPLGQGQQDMPAILEACREVDIDCYIVEEDDCELYSIFEEIKISLDYLRSMGFQKK